MKSSNVVTPKLNQFNLVSSGHTLNFLIKSIHALLRHSDMASVKDEWMKDNPLTQCDSPFGTDPSKLKQITMYSTKVLDQSKVQPYTVLS